MAKKKPTIASFEVGEIAAIVYSRTGRVPVGAEVEIVEPLRHIADLDSGPKRCYGIFWVGSPETLYVTPDQLRKLAPPGDPLTLVKWSECPWQPKEVATR